MNNDLHLPDDDRDRQLARRLNTLLEEGKPVNSLQASDTLVASLLALKETQASEHAPSAETSSRMWAQVEAHVDAQPQLTPAQAPERPPLRRVQQARIYRLASARTWISMAASLIILLGIAWLLLPDVPAEAQLVASSGTEIATYTAPDGSVITLRPHSDLYALDVSDTHMMYRLEGEGYFIVTSNPERTFSVDANNGRVSVLGTQFNVSTWGNTTTVYLEEGRVRFADLRSDDTTELVPGQRATLTEDGALLTPTTESNDDYLDWMRGEMTFEQRPLRQILAELGHHYAITFAIDEALLTQTISGRLDLSDQTLSLDDLGNVLGGRFVEMADSTYRFE